MYVDVLTNNVDGYAFVHLLEVEGAPHTARVHPRLVFGHVHNVQSHLSGTLHTHSRHCPVNIIFITWEIPQYIM